MPKMNPDTWLIRQQIEAEKAEQSTPEGLLKAIKKLEKQVQHQNAQITQRVAALENEQHRTREQQQAAGRQPRPGSARVDTDAPPKRRLFGWGNR